MASIEKLEYIFEDPNPQPERPPFDLIKGAVTVEQQLDSEKPEWPDYTFEFSEQNLFGKYIPKENRELATNPAARVRTVINGIENEVPGCFGDLPRPLDKTTTAMRRYLSSKITVNGQEQPRVVVVKQGEVFSEIWKKLQEENHPLAQAAEQVIHTNKTRQEDNMIAGKDEQKKVMSDYEIIELLDDLLLTARSADVKAGFESRIKALRKAK